mgnify:CR=1 FL=1
MSIVDQRLSLFLASLRVLQQAMENNGTVDLNSVDEIMTNSGVYPWPTPEDIDDVCEDLNCDSDQVRVVENK